MRVHRSLREKEKIGGMGIHQSDQIGQGRTISAGFLGVDSEKSEALPLVGGSMQRSRGRVPLGLRDARGTQSMCGEMSPVEFEERRGRYEAVRGNWGKVQLGSGRRFRR